MSTGVVLLHAPWHGAWSWQLVLPRLVAGGRTCLAVDLAAHGLNARFPRSYLQRPLDRAAFATELSPVAGTTLAEDVACVRAAAEALRDAGHGPVTIVAHSLGGISASQLAQESPELVERIVYVAAFLPVGGLPPLDYTREPENAGDLVFDLVVADLAATGVLRIDPRSDDEAYRAAIRAAFFADVEPGLADRAISLMSPDAPLGPFRTPLTLTADRWGSVPRSYVRCRDDMTLMLPMQDRFVAEADASTPGVRTRVETLDTSHSPYLSAPAAFADLLLELIG